MKNTLATIVAFLIIFSTLTLTAQADEGMWQPHQLPAMSDELAAKGLEIDAVSISSLTEFPMNAVISLGVCIVAGIGGHQSSLRLRLYFAQFNA